MDRLGDVCAVGESWRSAGGEGRSGGGVSVPIADKEHTADREEESKVNSGILVRSRRDSPSICAWPSKDDEKDRGPLPKVGGASQSSSRSSSGGVGACSPIVSDKFTDTRPVEDSEPGDVTFTLDSGVLGCVCLACASSSANCSLFRCPMHTISPAVSVYGSNEKESYCISFVQGH